jgi:hypothetical protein
MAENAEIERIAIDLTLGIQADMFIEFALGFSVSTALQRPRQSALSKKRSCAT